MTIMRSFTAATVAAILAVSVPVTSANAAVRASQAVPAATEYRGDPSRRAGLSGAWPVWIIAAITAALAVYVTTKSDDDDISTSGDDAAERAISRG